MLKAHHAGETSMQDADRAVELDATQLPPPPPSGDETNTLASFLLVGGLALAIFILLRRIYRRPPARGTDAGLTPKERIEAVKKRASTNVTSGERKHLERSMSEAEELTRRLAAILDNKAARLEVLIDDADERLRRLEALEGRSGDRANGNSEGDAGPRTPIRPRIDPAALDRARLVQLNRERDEPPTSDDESSEATPAPEASVRERVYALADGGADAIQIAKELDQPVGQVELMLNLRRQTG